MPEPAELISPVALTPAKLEQQLRGPETDFQPRWTMRSPSSAEGRDVMVLEGGRSLREGYVAGLPPQSVVELVDAGVLVVIKYDDTLMVDRAMTAQNYFGKHFLGVVINEVPKAQAEIVKDVIVPFLTRHNITVFGVLPGSDAGGPQRSRAGRRAAGRDPVQQRMRDELVEHMLVGAMGVESALSYFRRKPHKAVITGGDRTDMQLAALETSTSCLILTGNIYPSPSVLNRAEELCVPVLLSKLDTLATIEIIEGFFGKSRFQQPKEDGTLHRPVGRKHLDYAALYKAMGLK